MDAYRAYLPRLASAGRSCSTTLRRIGTDSAVSAPALRSNARLISRRIVSALGPYERHLSRVWVAFGWDRRPRAAPRPGS
jgi:hypothetical protein